MANAPVPVSPCSSAVRTGSLLFIAAQVGIDPHRGAIVEGGTAAQTRQVMQNPAAIAHAAGSALDAAVQTTAFLTSFDDFAVTNEIYAEFPGTASPATSPV